MAFTGVFDIDRAGFAEDLFVVLEGSTPQFLERLQKSSERSCCELPAPCFGFVDASYAQRTLLGNTANHRINPRAM